MDLLTVLYTASGFVFAAAFLPQIITLLKDRTGAVSLSLRTWLLFSVTSVIGLAYAVTHNGDQYFIFCSAVAVLGNLTVLGLASLRRIQLYHTSQTRAGAQI